MMTDKRKQLADMTPEERHDLQMEAMRALAKHLGHTQYERTMRHRTMMKDLMQAHLDRKEKRFREDPKREERLKREKEARELSKISRN